MSTVTKPSGPGGNGGGVRPPTQLQRDRITGFLVLLFMIVLFGLILWLAMVSGADVTPADNWMLPL